MKEKPAGKKTAASLLLCVCLGFGLWPAQGAFPSLPVIHLINDSAQNIYGTLTTSIPFVTDFKGAGDVTVTDLAGSVGPDYTDTFGGEYSFGNPDYVTNFVGAASNGTGDGTVGDLVDIQTSPGLAIQFDFAMRLTPTDRLIIIDCDFSKQFQVQAFIKNGSTFTAESLGNWVVQNFAGSTQEQPNSSFPSWNASSGLLTAQTSDILDEPLTAFIPDQAVDRVIITQKAGTATGSVQFFSLPPNLGALGIALSGTNVLITVPVGVVSPYVQTTISLASPAWTTMTNTTLTNLAVPAVITIPVTNTQQYFRLFY